MRYFIYCRKSSEGEERQVLSLASQQEALAKSFGDKADIQIVGVYEEAKSAKTPGRPLFSEMLKRIEAGEAEGIVSWAPDRLARNSIDGGHIIYLLDRGELRDLKFATYTFENNPQGKFMLGIMFNQSKYYSDALSENVKRGNATKVAMGWRPNMAPIGYLNCAATRTIIPDPTLFPLVRRMFELFLSGSHTPREIARIAEVEWGFLTPRKTRSGGRPLGRSTIYRILANPFYAGVLQWNGDTYRGRHQAVLTAEEFERAQQLLHRRARPRPSRHTFLFAGLLSCGSCGHAISAEHKVNRHGSHYTYYHCAARGRLSRPCGEPSIEERALTAQFNSFLRRFAITPEAAAWVKSRLRTEQRTASEIADKIVASQTAAKSEIAAQLKELTSLRIRRMVNDEEFVGERGRLEEARKKLEEAPKSGSKRRLFELFDLVEQFSNQAVKWFETGSVETKRKLIKIVCSNPALTDKILSVQAAKPFVTRSDLGDGSHLRRVVDERRTSAGEGEPLLTTLHEIEASGELDDLIDQLRPLTELFPLSDPLPRVRKRRSDAGQRRLPPPASSSLPYPSYRPQ